MSDDEITTMVLTACVYNGVEVTGIKIKKRTVVVSTIDRTANLKRSALPARSVGDVGTELRRKLGAIV